MSYRSANSGNHAFLRPLLDTRYELVLVYVSVSLGCHNKAPHTGLNSRNLFLIVLETGSPNQGASMVGVW